MLTNALKWVVANLTYDSCVFIGSIQVLHRLLAILQAVHNRRRGTFRNLIHLSLGSIFSSMRMGKTWNFLRLLFSHLWREKNLRYKKWWLNSVRYWFWFSSRISRLCVYIDYSSRHRKFCRSRGEKFVGRSLCLLYDAID